MGDQKERNAQRDACQFHANNHNSNAVNKCKCQCLCQCQCLNQCLCQCLNQCLCQCLNQCLCQCQCLNQCQCQCLNQCLCQCQCHNHALNNKDLNVHQVACQLFRNHFVKLYCYSLVNSFKVNLSNAFIKPLEN